jgi:hypothetical protein
MVRKREIYEQNRLLVQKGECLHLPTLSDMCLVQTMSFERVQANDIGLYGMMYNWRVRALKYVPGIDLRTFVTWAEFSNIQILAGAFLKTFTSFEMLARRRN